MFVETGILSEEELHAHYEVRLEEYALKLQIESRTMAEMCMNQVLPVAVHYQNVLMQNINALKGLDLGEESYSAQLFLVKEISTCVNVIRTSAYEMKDEREKAGKLDSRAKAYAYCDNVKPIMETLRNAADDLEQLVDDEVWPLVKYRELLFLR